MYPAYSFIFRIGTLVRDLHTTTRRFMTGCSITAKLHETLQTTVTTVLGQREDNMILPSTTRAQVSCPTLPSRFTRPASSSTYPFLLHDETPQIDPDYTMIVNMFRHLPRTRVCYSDTFISQPSTSRTYKLSTRTNQGRLNNSGRGGHPAIQASRFYSAVFLAAIMPLGAMGRQHGDIN